MFLSTVLGQTVRNIGGLLSNSVRMPLALASQRMSSTQMAPSMNSMDEDAEDDTLYKRLQIEVRSGDRAVLDSYEKFVAMAAQNLEINHTRTWEPFRHIQRRTLLRSAFVKKKYRVQYEWRTYFRCLEFKHLTGSTAETFLEYIERNLPEGCIAKVTKERIEPLFESLQAPTQQ